MFSHLLNYIAYVEVTRDLLTSETADCCVDEDEFNIAIVLGVKHIYHEQNEGNKA